MRRLIVLAFGVLQLILLARLAIDFRVISAGANVAGPIVRLSEALAAPVQVVADAIGVNFDAAPGGGMDPAIITALIVWTILEAIVLMIFSRFG